MVDVKEDTTKTSVLKPKLYYIILILENYSKLFL